MMGELIGRLGAHSIRTVGLISRKAAWAKSPRSHQSANAGLRQERTLVFAPKADLRRRPVAQAIRVLTRAGHELDEAPPPPRDVRY